MPAPTSAALSDLFTNPWLWAAIGLSLLLHVFVLYVPFLQQAFSTALSATTGWRARRWRARCWWLREVSKVVTRATLRVDAREPSRAWGRGGGQRPQELLVWILAQVSRSATVRLKIGRSGVESGSRQK